MRIAILQPNMDVKGGAENIVVWLGNGLRRKGHRVTVITERFTPEHWPEAMVGPLDVRVLPSAVLGRLLNSRTVRFWERSRQLGRMLGEFDLVIAKLFPSYCWATSGREQKSGSWKIVWLCPEPERRLYPDITYSHLLQWRSLVPEGVENPHLDDWANQRFRRSKTQQQKDARNRRWDAKAVSQCDLVVTNSAFTAGAVRDIFSIEPVVCHHGIPLPPEPEYCHGEYVAVLTTLAARKNVPNMIRAIAELVRRGRTDMIMRIAGRGPDRPKLEKLTADLGVGGNVHFIGPLPDEKLPEFYRKARLAVYCPIDEPFGLVPLEAAAVKTPVVVSNHGGPAEIIEHGVTGLHANPFDPRSIADGIEELWAAEERCRWLAEAACRQVRDYYSLDAFVDRFEKVVTQNL